MFDFRNLIIKYLKDIIRRLEDNFDFTPYEEALNPVVAEEEAEAVVKETQEP